MEKREPCEDYVLANVGIHTCMYPYGTQNGQVLETCDGDQHYYRIHCLICGAEWGEADWPCPQAPR